MKGMMLQWMERAKSQLVCRNRDIGKDSVGSFDTPEYIVKVTIVIKLQKKDYSLFVITTAVPTSPMNPNVGINQMGNSGTAVALHVQKETWL